MVKQTSRHARQGRSRCSTPRVFARQRRCCRLVRLVVFFAPEKSGWEDGDLRTRYGDMREQTMVTKWYMKMWINV